MTLGEYSWRGIMRDVNKVARGGEYRLAEDYVILGVVGVRRAHHCVRRTVRTRLATRTWDDAPRERFMTHQKNELAERVSSSS